jgi:hypothetical protein
MSFSFMVYSFVSMEHLYKWLAEKRSMGSGGGDVLRP